MAVLAVLLAVNFTTREAVAARPREAPTSSVRDAQAKALGTSPELLSAPEAFRAKEARDAALRRLTALQRMREFARANETEARAARAKQAAEAVRSAQESQRLQLALARGKARKQPEPQLKAAAVRESPTLSRTLTEPPKSRPKLTPAQSLPKHEKAPQPAAAQPRSKPEVGALPLDVESLYAAVAGEGAELLLADGSLVASDRAAWAETQRTRREIQLAGLFSDLGLPVPLLGALPAPTPDDTARTPEDAPSPALGSAAAINATVLRMYNFVHRNIAPALYYGSKQGADMTLRTGRGNDFDTASLLIALLRGAGIPARYEYGTVRLSLGQALALTGGATAQEAAYQLSQAGIPAGVGAGGTSVLMERAWVRAWVPYGDYKGAGPQSGESIWVRLDPGMKVVAWPQAAPDLRGLATFDFNAFLSSLNSRTPLEVYEAQLLTAARAKNLCNTLTAAAYEPILSQEDLTLLPAEHPAKVETSLLLFARPPSIFRWGVDVSVDGVSHHFESVELQGHPLSLRFPGATAADEATIAAAGGLTNVTPFKVRVAGSLRLDGVEVKRFAPVIPGTRFTLDVRVSVPNGSTPATVAATHDLVAGGAYAVNVTSGAQDAKRADALRSALPGKSGDDFVETAGHAANALYAHHQEAAALRLTQQTRHALVEDVLESVAGRQLQVQEAFGVPVALANGPYFIDVRRDSLTPVARDGKSGQLAHHVRLLSMHGSILENAVWEEIFATPSLSAVKVLQAASLVGTSLVTLNAGGTTFGLTGYSAAALDDMGLALGAGWQVVAPQRPVSYAQYPDVEAYLLLNPVTGAGANKIGYDSRNLLASAQLGSGGLVQVQHDALGRRTAVIRPNGVRSDWAFDDGSQVTSLTHSKGGAALLGFSYEYDSRGMRTKKTREDGTWEGYGLDAALRLNEVRYSSGRVVTFTLDSWGNRSSSFDSAQPAALRTLTYTVNGANETTRVASSASVFTDHVFDSNGSLLSQTAGANVTGFSYTKDNRLAQVTQPGGVVSSYEYDARGVRTKKVEAGVETDFLLDGASVLAELDSGGALTALYLNNRQGIDEQFALKRGGADFYPLHDALGSIVAISDATGAIVSRFTYEVSGERTVVGAGPPLAFGFTGREHDSTGQRYHRDRYVNPSVGAFTQVDRLGALAGANQYLYANNRPASAVDPSGFLFATPLTPARTTVEAYAFWHFASFIALLIDIGAVSAAAVQRTYGPLVEGTFEYCDAMQATGVRRRTLYRGLSPDDLWDLKESGGQVIRSYAARGKITDLEEGFRRSLDPQEAILHSAGRTGNSVFVSTTTKESIARQIALEPGYTRKFVRILTPRIGVPGTIPTEFEVLLFWQLGGWTGEVLSSPEPAD